MSQLCQFVAPNYLVFVDTFQATSSWPTTSDSVTALDGHADIFGRLIIIVAANMVRNA